MGFYHFIHFLFISITSYAEWSKFHACGCSSSDSPEVWTCRPSESFMIKVSSSWLVYLGGWQLFSSSSNVIVASKWFVERPEILWVSLSESRVSSESGFQRLTVQLQGVEVSWFWPRQLSLTEDAKVANIYIHICVCIYIYIFIYIYIHTYRHIYIHIYIYIYMYIYTYTYDMCIIFIYSIYIYTHYKLHVLLCMCICIYIEAIM